MRIREHSGMVPKSKKPANQRFTSFLYQLVLNSAEEEGFEPPEPFSSTVFKTAAFDRSATPLCASGSRPSASSPLRSPYSSYARLVKPAGFGTANVPVYRFSARIF